MRSTYNPYAHCDGPPRALRNLDDWTTEGGRQDRALDEAIADRERADRERARAVPDVYEVADRVLAPLVEKQRTVPRRLRAVIPEALEARGVRPTRAAQLTEAARMLAQEKAASDPELSLALLLRAAMMFRPEGGWKRDHGPRKTDGFRSVRDLLMAAFSEAEIGAGSMPLEIAQNRARTRSLPGEVFVQASHSGSSRARNAAAVERSLDAQRLIARAHLHPRDVRLLFERHVLGRHTERPDLLDVLRQRSADVLGVTLPPRTGLTEDDWRRQAGEALHGPPAPGDGPEAERMARHVRRCDAALLAVHDEAEQALRVAIGQGRRRPRQKPPAPVPRRQRATTASEMLHAR